MAAYAALVSVMHILDQIEHHPFPPLSLHKHQLDSLTRNVVDLQEFLQGYNLRVSNNNEADPLEMRIADAAYAAEDVIESNVVDRILIGSKNQKNEMGFKFFRGSKEPKDDGETINHIHTNLYEGLQRVIEEMDLLKKEVTEVVADRDQLPRNVSPFSDSSIPSSFGQKSTMVGNGEVLLEIMEKLADGRSDRHVIPIVGMGGIGKTTLARTIYARHLIIDHFDILAWVTISQQYDTKELLCQLVFQANKEEDISKLSKMSKMTEDEVGLRLHKCLSSRRFLIVLDDMWSIEAWDEIQRYFPNNSNSSRIMVTTRLSNLGSLLDNSYGVDMKFLDEVSGWNLFSEIVFGGRNCPQELEIIGKEIVEKCRGLPLSIVVMGGILQNMEHTIECWESISRNLTASTMNLENNEQCLRILKMSYNYLPVHLKPCFLFMGVYEEDTTIRVSALINLWVSEGFLRPISSKSLETVGKEYLKELVDRRLIQVDELGSTGNIKYCKMHDLVRDLCLREAENERFYHVVGRHSLEGARDQRRIVVMGSASKKEVREALESMTHARSCICENEEAGMLPNSRLLRTFKAYRRDTEIVLPLDLNARLFESSLRYYEMLSRTPSSVSSVNSTIRYYYFANRDHKFLRQKYSLWKVFKLVNLRYLVVEVHWFDKFPSSVGLLWNLQTLVVARSRKVEAPVEIWKMPQLRHLHFSERSLYLPDPPRDDVVVIMENLQTLTGVRNLKCSEEVVRRIPNIKKLGIYYKRDNWLGVGVDYYCLGNLECLRKLESLSCHVHWNEPFKQKLSFPVSLRKLSLLYIRLSEDVMEKIGSLPLLQKLKLEGVSFFETGKWESVEGQFGSLKSLSLFFPHGLKEWVMEESSHFPCLEQLRLVGVQELEEIPAEIGEIPTLQSIQLMSCSAPVVKSAQKIVEQQQELQGDQLSFKVHVWNWKWLKLETAPNPNIHYY